MRKLFATIILICLLYFVGGYIAVKYGVVTRDDYFAYAGVVGGLASVAGLLALTRPAINQSDVQAIEISALKSMTQAAEELQQLQIERSKTREEIGSLAARKKEMELLVRKASLALFLKEQLAHYERRILEEVSRNDQLKSDLANVRGASRKLAALNEEIDRDPNVEHLQAIISSAASARQTTLQEAISEMPTFVRGVFLALRSISRLVSPLFFKL
jgi:hypothetical protein